MAIDELRVCVWAPNWTSYETILVENPTWIEIEKAIHTLDGETRNDLYLQPERSNNGTYLTVGGGDGRYIVTGAINQEVFPTAVNGSGDTQLIEDLLMVGGQNCDFPREFIVDLETALRAARSFFETRQFAGGEVEWKYV